MKARDIMTTKVLAIRDDDLAQHAVEIMADHKISGMPVVNDSGKLIGIITESDLLLLEREKPPLMPTALYGLYMMRPQTVEDNATRRGVLVEDLMTKKVITFNPEDKVIEIAKVMHDKHINRVIITENEQVVGVISRHDVIRCMAEGKSLSD